MRLATLFTIAIVSTLSLVACGPSGDDDGNGGSPDANTSGDPPDANTGGGNKEIGDSCVPDQADPQGPGDCGVGFTCLSLQGGNGAWCSKSCTANTDCTGYTGPGAPACAYGIDFGNGTPVDFCGIVCNDLPGDPVVCPAGACTGTCPGALMCTAPLNSNAQPPVHVADACI